MTEEFMDKLNKHISITPTLGRNCSFPSRQRTNATCTFPSRQHTDATVHFHHANARTQLLISITPTHGRNLFISITPTHGRNCSFTGANDAFQINDQFLVAIGIGGPRIVVCRRFEAHSKMARELKQDPANR